MEADELYDLINTTPSQKILEVLEANKHEIRLLFLRSESDLAFQHTFQNTLIVLNAKVTSIADRTSVQYQGLIIHLGFYFKRVSARAALVECIQTIHEGPLKNRLKAFVFHKGYNNVQQHISLFDRLIALYNSATSDEFDDYTNDVLIDLFEYKRAALEQFNSFKQSDKIPAFLALFTDHDKITKFPILNLFQSNKSLYTHEIGLEAYKNRIYEPSTFTEVLFNQKFIIPLKNDARTIWHRTILGFDTDYIRYEIINRGQTNFDLPHRSLSSAEVVMLYCYCNMRMHYYSGIFLLERFTPLIDFYRSDGRIKFIDIGCGPATSGIALLDYLQMATNEKVIFDYYAVDYYASMLAQAKNMMRNSKFDEGSNLETIKSLSEFQSKWLDNSSCIIFNTSYLFASPSLDEVTLANEINKIRALKPFIPCYLLFQNSVDPRNNVKYDSFKKHLKFINREYSQQITIRYTNQRNSSFEPTSLSVNYEILKL